MFKIIMKNLNITVFTQNEKYIMNKIKYYYDIKRFIN